MKRDKKKYSEENNINSSKRTIGPLTLDFRRVLNNNQEKQIKNIISSSEGSKDIDFDKNVNVVINPYCIILNKKNEQNQNENVLTTEAERQNKKIKKIILNENENKKEVLFHRNKELLNKNKIIFTNIEKNNDSNKSNIIKINEE